MAAPKRMRACIIGAPIVAVGVCLGCMASAEDIMEGVPVNGLEARLSTSIPIVHQGGVLALELELRNVSDQPLSLYQHVTETRGMPGEVEFLVRRGEDPNAMFVPQSIVERTPPTAADYVRLPPGASLRRSLHMPVERVGPLDERPGPFEPGPYRVSVRVAFSDEGRHAGVPDAWEGSAISNPVAIEVVPAGAEPAPLDDRADSMQIEVWLDQEVMAEDESVPVRVKLRNASARPLGVYRHLVAAPNANGEIVFLIEDEGGRPIAVTPPQLDRPLPQLTDFVLLEPYRAVEVQADLEPAHWPIRPGRYRLQVQVNVRADSIGDGVDMFPVNEAWTGSLMSDPVHFFVIVVDRPLMPPLPLMRQQGD